MLNLYVMPMRGVGSDADPFRPKYVAEFGTSPWRLFDYRGGQLALLGLVDVTPAVNTALLAHADVFAVSTDIDAAIGSQRLADARTFIRAVRDALLALRE